LRLQKYKKNECSKKNERKKYFFCEKLKKNKQNRQNLVKRN